MHAYAACVCAHAQLFLKLNKLAGDGGGGGGWRKINRRAYFTHTHTQQTGLCILM